KEHRTTPADIMAHFDDYRKMFWDTYPDKPFHEEAREAFAQALFLKDIHYLQTDLFIKNHLKDTPYKDAGSHDDSQRTTVGQTVGQVLSNASTLDGSINPDGG